jgi:hypothetical protein
VSSNDEMLQQFAKISRGMSPEQVKSVLGSPAIELETSVPDDSAWGMQDIFWIKIPAGKPCLEWVYRGTSVDFTIWFAFDNQNWTTALKLPIPRTVRES